MNLMTGYTRTERRGNSASGRKHDVPQGPSHAVDAETPDRALCGVSIDPSTVEHPWPSGLGARCRDCMHNAAPAATPL